MITIFWLLCIQTLQNYVGHFHSCIGYWGTIKPLGQNGHLYGLSTTHFFISNLVSQAPDLNLGENLSNLLSNREDLNY